MIENVKTVSFFYNQEKRKLCLMDLWIYPHQSDRWIGSSVSVAKRARLTNLWFTLKGKKEARYSKVDCYHFERLSKLFAFYIFLM